MVNATNVVEIELDKISVSELNTRKDLAAGSEDADIDGLANSIRERGLLSHVIVRMRADGGYELIAGQRRFLAVKMLGWDTITAVVRNDLDDNAATVVSLVENVQRADMNPMDKARAFQSILSELGDDKAVAKETGFGVATVRRYLALLNLKPSIQEKVSTSDGPAGILTLSRVADTFPEEEQEKVFEEIGGFNQRIQGEMLKHADGDLNKLKHLGEQALEGALDVRTCHEGLCFKMPEEWKAKLKEMLHEEQLPDMASVAKSLRFP